MAANRTALHRPVVEQMVRRAAVPFAQPTRADAIVGALVDALSCGPFGQ